MLLHVDVTLRLVPHLVLAFRPVVPYRYGSFCTCGDPPKTRQVLTPRHPGTLLEGISRLQYIWNAHGLFVYCFDVFQFCQFLVDSFDLYSETCL